MQLTRQQRCGEEADRRAAARTDRGATRPRHLVLAGTADRLSPGAEVLDFATTPRAARGALPNRSIRVLIADARALVRAGYRALLEADAGIDIVAEADSSHPAVALARETVPDVALLDQELPGLEDPRATFSVLSHSAFAGVAVTLMVAGEDDARLFSALRAGAVGVLRKDNEAATLIQSVRLLATGQALLPKSAVRRLLGDLSSPRAQHNSLRGLVEELTERERVVVALVAEGLTNDQVAARLLISSATVKTHVSRAMLKLHARHRAELVVFAYESGLVAPSDPRVANVA
jgi:DNA-binding NarL/FixJ family response regulator